MSFSSVLWQVDLLLDLGLEWKGWCAVDISVSLMVLLLFMAISFGTMVSLSMRGSQTFSSVCETNTYFLSPFFVYLA